MFRRPPQTTPSDPLGAPWLFLLLPVCGGVCLAEEGTVALTPCRSVLTPGSADHVSLLYTWVSQGTGHHSPAVPKGMTLPCCGVRGGSLCLVAPLFCRLLLAPLWREERLWPSNLCHFCLITLRTITNESMRSRVEAPPGEASPRFSCAPFLLPDHRNS